MNISISAEPVFHIGSFPVTNSLITSWIVVILLILISLRIKSTLKKIPTGIQNIAEFIIESFYDLVKGIAGENTAKIFPFIATFFIFILFSNWLGLIPGIGSIGIFKNEEGKRILVPLLRSATADLNTTLALALVSVLGTQVFAIKNHGFSTQIKKYLNLKSPMDFFIGILELIGEFSRIISFAFRLFGNIFAGEVLLTIIAFLVPVFVSIPFLGLEIFVGFIQAIVFSMLTLVFVSVAMSHEAEQE